MIDNIFDTHAHYDDEKFDCDREETLRRIHREGVKSVINCGCDEKSSRTALSLAEKYDFIYAAVGIHPENITPNSMDELSAICEMAKNKKVVAIGEIGLDYYWDDTKKKEQKELFRAQTDIANDFSLPVIIHDREAHADVMAILREKKPSGVLHCFSGSVEMATEALKLGMYIGFGGALTFKNARKCVEVARGVPIDRFVFETDCPYMAPVPLRGKRNESPYIAYVAEKMAQIKGLTAQEVVNLAFRNAEALFSLK